MSDPHRKEPHLVGRIGWLRAAVLGANDGIISTASLMLGVASASTSTSEVFVAGVAGLIAGALSMAAGEYVSVSSQADTERADLTREQRHLAADPEFEKRELAEIYARRGVEPALARKVAEQLMAKDALGAHARDELGISEVVAAKPIEAALTLAATFSVGAALPLGAALIAPPHALPWAVSGLSLVCLAALGALGAKIGGARIRQGALRVAFWGALAMAITAGVGALVGRAV